MAATLTEFSTALLWIQLSLKNVVSNWYLVTIGSDDGLCLAAALQCRHNGSDGFSSHQPHDCLLNRWIRRRSKKTPKLRVTGLCAENHWWPVNSPHKWPVTRKMFPFDDVIMKLLSEPLTTLFAFTYTCMHNHVLMEENMVLGWI